MNRAQPHSAIENFLKIQPVIDPVFDNSGELRVRFSLQNLPYPITLETNESYILVSATALVPEHAVVESAAIAIEQMKMQKYSLQPIYVALSAYNELIFCCFVSYPDCSACDLTNAVNLLVDAHKKRETR